MNAVILYNYEPPMINGSVINAIEYFLCAFEYNPAMKLVLLNTKEETKRLFIQMIKERYDLTGIEGYHNNIILLDIKTLLKGKFDTVLVLDYSTIRKTRGLLNADKILVISEKHTTDPEFFYSKKLNNVTYYGEMPFQYKDEDYTMKMLFNRYKPLNNVREATYIHSPKNPDSSFIDNIVMPTKEYIFRKPGHLVNLFEQFSVFIYYHAHTWFDPQPRLMHECYYYGKQICYINDFKLKDGSWYRYHDLIENGLKYRILTERDEIVEQLI